MPGRPQERGCGGSVPSSTARSTSASVRPFARRPSRPLGRRIVLGLDGAEPPHDVGGALGNRRDRVSGCAAAAGRDPFDHRSANPSRERAGGGDRIGDSDAVEPASENEEPGHILERALEGRDAGGVTQLDLRSAIGPLDDSGEARSAESDRAPVRAHGARAIRGPRRSSRGSEGRAGRRETSARGRRYRARERETSSRRKSPRGDGSGSDSGTTNP